MELNRIIQGDCLEAMQNLSDGSIDSIVTDPPYELGFMNKTWDKTGIAYNIKLWQECLRVLKPGGHLLAFGGSRTYHRMACAIEDAGFEIRDQIMWIYGSGFPKSLNVSKAINKMAGNTEAQQWSGWGTALKPAHEPIVLARKPLGEKNVAENVLKWGAGGINIDGCRVPTGSQGKPLRTTTDGKEGMSGMGSRLAVGVSDEGRFPANVILDEEAGQMLDEKSGRVKCGVISPEHNFMSKPGNGVTHGSMDRISGYGGYLDTGGASRFFYCSKASKADRGQDNNHPTVKPVKLIEYLIKLVTPPDGTVLDMFGGSGTTGVAAINCGRSFALIEKELEYVEIANRRIEEAMR